LIGLDRFVEILHEANVDPNWIVNDNIKAKLLALKSKYSSRSENTRAVANRHMDKVEEKKVDDGDDQSVDMRLTEPRISSSPPPNIAELNKVLKRKRQTDEESDTAIPKKKVKNRDWEEVSDSDNE
jgi:hypothetical protein